MKIYFIRHADTFATEHGLIQGSANGEQNRLSEKGKQTVREKTVPEIERIIRENRGKEIVIYSGLQQRHYETLLPIIQMLEEKYHYIPDEEHMIFDKRLDGRNYGALEGMSESELRKKRSLITKPAKIWSYLFAQAGLKNLARVEKKSAYNQKVFDMVYEMFVNHKDNQVILVVGGSDFFKTMQRCGDIARLCYFGDEEIDISPNANGLKSSMKIGAGEVKPIIIEKPAYVESRERFMSTPEKYATRKFVSYGKGSELQ